MNPPSASSQSFPMRRYLNAQSAIASGNYSGALYDLLWCLDHGPSIDPAFVSVRATFVIGTITSLFDCCPQARTELVKRRDAQMSRFIRGGGDWIAIQFLFALNRAIGQGSASFLAVSLRNAVGMLSASDADICCGLLLQHLGSSDEPDNYAIQEAASSMVITLFGAQSHDLLGGAMSSVDRFVDELSSILQKSGRLGRNDDIVRVHKEAHRRGIASQQLTV